MAEKQKTALDEAFEEVESTFGENRVIRREMINQLRKQVTKMEISEFDKLMSEIDFTLSFMILADARIICIFSIHLRHVITHTLQLHGSSKKV